MNSRSWKTAANQSPARGSMQTDRIGWREQSKLQCAKPSKRMRTRSRMLTTLSRQQLPTAWQGKQEGRPLNFRLN
eukprot:3287713-Amphidinium_carterae.1